MESSTTSSGISTAWSGRPHAPLDGAQADRSMAAQFWAAVQEAKDKGEPGVFDFRWPGCCGYEAVAKLTTLGFEADAASEGRAHWRMVQGCTNGSGCRRAKGLGARQWSAASVVNVHQTRLLVERGTDATGADDEFWREAMGDGSGGVARLNLYRHGVAGYLEPSAAE